jgi:hypothetical protein
MLYNVTLAALMQGGDGNTSTRFLAAAIRRDYLCAQGWLCLRSCLTVLNRRREGRSEDAARLRGHG